MKRNKHISFLFRMLIVSLLTFIFIKDGSINKVYAQDAATEFQQANTLYQKQQYDSAATIYEKLIGDGKISADIYYNLGNCYYKLDQNPRAILNYERALKINPDDEDIAFNLKVAQLKVVDKIDAVPEIFYRRWLNALASSLTPDGWSRLIIALTWLTFLFGAVYITSSGPRMKRIGFLLAAFFFLVTVVSWTFSRQSYDQQVIQKDAVVMSVSAYVKSSPGENNTDLFVLHEGARVAILDRFENWVKIRIANGSVGWMKETEIEEI